MNMKKETKQKEIELLFTLQGRDKIKVFTLCTENICRLLRDHEIFKDKLKFDEFTQLTYVNFDNGWEQIKDYHTVKVMNEIAKNFSFFQKVSNNMVNEAIIVVAQENKFDSAKDYFKSLKWDNVPRVDTWLSETYGVENNEYHRSVGSNWIKGLVKRIVYPGCKFDHILVIEGEQGTGKSTSLSVLGGQWYLETFMNTESKDFFMQFTGNAIIEFSEGETLNRTDVKRMKAIITTQVDRYRAPYARFAEDHPRRCVFAMTTNETEYLKDDTGNRRWLPIRMERSMANIEWLRENRDQLFAEAYHRVVSLKESVYEFPIEEMRRQQEARMEESPYQERIEDWFFNQLKQDARNKGITAQLVWETVINATPSFSKPITRYEEMVITGIFKKIGLEKRRIMVNGRRCNRWFLKDEFISTTTLKVTDYINDYDDL